MPNEIMEAVFARIAAYDTIMLFRHTRPDGDAKGATKGLQRILQLSFPEKTICLIHDDHSDYLDFLGDDDAQVPDEVYRRALGIVLDTATADRIGNPKYSLCRELVKIDHHIPVDNYGSVNWVEEHASSACELVAKLYCAFSDRLRIDTQAATAIYAGMVTDSGRFRFPSVSGDTLRFAAAMLDVGIDTERLFAHLYLQEPQELKFRAHICKKMKLTPNGVAYVYVTAAMQKKLGLSNETASTAVGFLDSIKGCLCWIAFIDDPNEPGRIRVRLRSRFVSINSLAEQYRGGGHACACGATVLSKKEMKALLAQADALVGQYKQTHEGWL